METATALEEVYWRILQRVPIEQRGRWAATNTGLTGGIQKLVSANDLDVGSVFAGVDPTSDSFHARTMRTQHGTLILITPKLIDVTNAASHVVAAAVDLWDTDAPSVSFPRARQQIDKLILAAATGVTFGAISVQLSEQRADFAKSLFGTLMNFVLAHELAHAKLGHLESSVLRLGTPGGVALDIVTPSWRLEFAADVEGFRLCEVMYGGELEVAAQYAGPTLFFEISDCALYLAEQAAGKSQEITYTRNLRTHPSATGRRNNLISFTHVDGPLADLPLVDAVVEFMARARRKFIYRPYPMTKARRKSLAVLGEYAERCNVERYAKMLHIGQEEQYLTALSPHEILTYMQEDFDQACAAIAKTVLYLLAVSPALDEAPRMYLGVLCAAFAHYQELEDYKQAAGNFERHVLTCVPDLTACVLAVGRLLYGQLDSTLRETSSAEPGLGGTV